MHFLAGTLIVLAIIYFMIVSPGFRKFAIFLLIALGIAIYWLVDSNQKDSEKRQQAQAAQERLALTSIHLEELNLSNISLANRSYSGWTIKGTVNNNSKYNLGSIRFLVTIQDCPPSGVCKTIGQETTTTMSADYSYPPKPLVPAGQVCVFESYAMKFANMPPTNNMRWEYKVTEIRAAF